MSDDSICKWWVSRRVECARVIISGMDTIFIHDLRVETRIGVYAWEQHLPQPLLIDLELALPSEKAFASDDFADTLDYAAVAKRVQAFAGR